MRWLQVLEEVKSRVPIVIAAERRKKTCKTESRASKPPHPQPVHPNTVKDHKHPNLKALQAGHR